MILLKNEVEIQGSGIFYREAGTGDPVIMVHGWTGSSYDWTKLMPLLADQYRVAAHDQLGFGKSNKPVTDYRLNNFVDLLSDFADALGVDRFHLVGNSMGGHISAAFALEHPDRVRTLTLLDSAGVKEGAPGIFFMGRFPGLISTLFRFTPLRTYSFIYKNFGPYHDSSFITREDVLGHYQSYGSKDRARPAAQCLRHLIYEPSAQLDGRLREIQTPTLIVWGAKDPLLPIRMSRVFLREIPGARREVIDSCGHCPQEEKPEELKRILLDFWEEAG